MIKKSIFMWLKGSTPHLERERIERILLIQLGDIGDVVLSLQCIRALKEAFASAQIVVAVWSKAKDLIEECPWADDIIVVERPQGNAKAIVRHYLGFLRKLMGTHFDLTIDLRTGTRGATMALLSGAKLRVSYNTFKETFWRNWIFTHLMPFIPDPNVHQSQHHQNLLTQIGIPIPKGYPEIRVSSESRLKAVALLAKYGLDETRPIIALHPFALWRYKEWPIEKMAEMAKRLTAQENVTLLILGSDGERKRAQSIIDACNDRAVNIAGETSLKVLAAIIEKCTMLVGMDSACGHISAAVGTPCLTIFGPGKAGVWAPLGSKNRIVNLPLPCIHCGQKGCPGTGRSRCLEELPVNTVLAAIKGHLNAIAPGLLTDRQNASIQQQ